jgi:predicted nucleic acid-binding protein
MQKIVIDSSVFLKQFLHEKDSKKTTTFLEKILRDNFKIIVPDLLVYEILSVVIRQKNVDLSEVVDFLDSAQKSELFLEKLSTDLIDKAKKIALSGNEKSGFPSFYDSVYHALAIINKCDFVTADKKHYDKTKKFGHIKLLSQVV